MSPPLHGVVEEESQSNVTLLASPTSAESVCQKGGALELKERNYMGLSDCSSADSLATSTIVNDNKSVLNLKATELCLGLPGSQSPERSKELCLLSSAQFDEKPFFPLRPSNVVSGNKRGFSDAMDGCSEGKFLSNSEVNVMLSSRPPPNLGLKTSCVLDNLGAQSSKAKEMVAPKVGLDGPLAANDKRSHHNESSNINNSAPASKAQVVGWPPIKSFRKNSLATTSKNTEEVDGKAGPGPMFVKVSLDGAPYLRKVDLRNYSAYQDLSSGLEKMFSCFTIGQYGSHGAKGCEKLSASKLMDLLHGSEYVLTYEDKDGDWMLVGDVPWDMFINTCKRLRIMKSSDAVGLAPRAAEKCKLMN